MIDTQEKIIESAILVFNDDLSAPLERVAEKASITRRTLHRYFKDRSELIALCGQHMRKRCSKAMAEALNSSEVPLEQLEQMLYAAVDCGVRYAFFHKLHSREGHQHRHENKDCAEYDAMYEQYERVIVKLQDEGTITKHTSVEWIFIFFTSVINATVQAETAGAVAKQHLKQFAWFSFSKGIGL
ncbi:TetR/AcrR family transcriptional regulator [Olivibacter sp. SDN3]|uniref:TetR/AcrR family transcriptional regulator n=1 Tax=Olivibacter sp. SDN3 TaxID=2764720 RepID=UPI0016514AD1|nr:TetR/AcrR family transcriptional regulator [Olivibacter sp. SDN3]QNL48260.1 TetR/AcrR family transcriptional regulator [Olivibacter sp. SDN3]